MRHVFLVGFMGAGKSTVGPLLAGLLGMPFLDLDDVIVSQAGRSVAEIFASEGEPGFRARERAALESLPEQPPSVVACGGGIVLLAENRATLARLGRVVFLHVDAATAYARATAAGGRPLLAEGGPQAAAHILTEREPLYDEVADVTIDTTDHQPDWVATQIVARLRED